MNERKVVDFDMAKGTHVEQRKNERLTKMRAAFRAAREAFSFRKPSLKKRSKKSKKKE
ncbi:MAG: hypothetical protein QGI68_15810 [Pseudomonadales bacterium]|nr:hypothetical protein [Pseudomonadales bacterium]MDP7359786.1 hypothetical protein [Pseudomonadales bacterium]MDP7597014.1 hypothetical protein [Pseudomonadales bacterium]HJN52217.1 hypothetical protein [Pseudomonadales bacterium]